MNEQTGCTGRFKLKLIFFSVGIIFGLIGGILWQEIFSPIRLTPDLDRSEEIKMFQHESREKLLKYIEGKWTSSIGDLIVNIEDSELNGSFIVLESTLQNPNRKEHFKVVSIDTVDGLLGLVILSVCNIETKCKREDILTVQLNKVFGIEKTITMSYEKGLSYCLADHKICTRAFKEID